MQPRLRRSRTEKLLAGVCGGLAEYFVIDPVIVRLIFVLGTLTTGIGFLVYPILWIVMPPGERRNAAAGAWQAPEQAGQAIGRETQQAWHSVASGHTTRRSSGVVYDDAATGDTVNLYDLPPDTQMIAPERPARRFGWAGVVLIGVGLMLLADFFHVSTQFVFPLILIAAGVAILVRKG